jgi:hypothetical protein
MFSEPVKGLIMIGVGAAAVYHGVAAVRRGVFATSYALYPRAQRPKGFWLHVSLFMAIGLWCAIAGVARLIDA